MLKRRTIICVLLFLCITIFIFKNSAKDAVESTIQSDSWISWAINHLSVIFKDRYTTTYFIRKLAHFAEFFMQGAALSGAIFSTGYHKKSIYVLFTGLLTACVDEYIQLFFEGRGSQISDVFVDFYGTCFAVICFLGLWYFLYFIKKAGK